MDNYTNSVIVYVSFVDVIFTVKGFEFFAEWEWEGNGEFDHIYAMYRTCTSHVHPDDVTSGCWLEMSLVGWSVTFSRGTRDIFRQNMCMSNSTQQVHCAHLTSGDTSCELTEIILMHCLKYVCASHQLTCTLLKLFLYFLITIITAF